MIQFRMKAELPGIEYTDGVPKLNIPKPGSISPKHVAAP